MVQVKMSKSPVEPLSAMEAGSQSHYFQVNVHTWLRYSSIHHRGRQTEKSNAASRCVDIDDIQTSHFVCVCVCRYDFILNIFFSLAIRSALKLQIDLL